MLLERVEDYKIVCIHKPPVNDEWTAYTRYVSDLLGGRFHYQMLRSREGKWTQTAVKEATGAEPAHLWQKDDGIEPAEEAYHPKERAIWQPAKPDLVIFGEPQPTWWQRALRRVQANRIVNHAQSPVLFARGPRVPIRRILWIIRDHEGDDVALRWLERLAVPSRAVITLLPIVPPYPRLYRRGDAAQFPMDVFEHDADSFLAGYVRWLDSKHIEGAVSRRQGDPFSQIRNEASSGSYDLIVIAAEPHGRWERMFLGEVVAPLLRWADRPVLVAR